MPTSNLSLDEKLIKWHKDKSEWTPNRDQVRSDILPFTDEVEDKLYRLPKGRPTNHNLNYREKIVLK